MLRIAGKILFAFGLFGLVGVLPVWAQDKGRAELDEQIEDDFAFNSSGLITDVEMRDALHALASSNYNLVTDNISLISATGNTREVFFNSGGTLITSSTGFLYSTEGNIKALFGNMWARQFCDESGAGCIDIATVAAVAGSDTYVQFNNAGSMGADSALTFNSATDALGTVDLVVTDDGSFGGNTFTSGTATAAAFSGPLTGNVTGNASTATALAANGANCSASQAPLGVDASGAVESCTDFEEELTNSAGLAAAISDESGTNKVAFTSNGYLSGTSLTDASELSFVSGSIGINYAPVKVPTRWYLAGWPGGGTTATNTTALTNDTLYAVPAIAYQPFTLETVAARTSTSNASSGAAIKVCVYKGDGTNSLPKTLLGSTSSGTSITDSSTSVDFTFTLDTAAAIPPGIFWIAYLQTSSTGARFVTNTTPQPTDQYLGTAANTILNGTGIPWSFSSAQAYSVGCPSTWLDGTGSFNTTIGNSVATVYKVD